MTRRHLKKRQMRATPELDVTTFMNLMVVLIPFLLISAIRLDIRYRNIIMESDAR